MRSLARIGLITMAHFSASILLIPAANGIFQKWFDTGLPHSLSEIVIQDLGIIFSFPCAVRAFRFHPARIAQGSLVVAVLVNSLLWGVVISLGVKWLVRWRGRYAQL
jgi:hypothetical protein